MDPVKTCRGSVCHVAGGCQGSCRYKSSAEQACEVKAARLYDNVLVKYPVTSKSEPDTCASPAVEDFTGKVDGKGYKRSFDDPSKIPLSLIDPEYLLGTGRVLQHGAKKYAPGNWMRGMSWSGVIDAQKRHLAAIERGEDRDPETGELHVYHIACCNMFLARFMAREEYKAFDDRLFKESGK